MQVAPEPQKKLSFFYALSMHILFLIALLTITNHKTGIFTFKNPSSIAEKEHMESMQAALIPGASNFGNPLILTVDDFINEAKPIPEEQTLENDSAAPEPEELHEEIKPEQTFDKKQSVPELPPADANNTKPIEHDAALEEITKSSIQRSPEDFSGTNNPPSTKQEQTCKPTKKNVKKPTFADLAHGFLQTLDHGGNDFLKRDGDPNKRPDFKELKYLTYVQRLVWHMQNEWRIQQANITLPNEDLSVTVAIVLNRDGSIRDVQLVRKSAYQAYDTYLIKGIYTANPYPSVPSFLPEDPFELTLTIQYSTDTRPWSINLGV